MTGWFSHEMAALIGAIGGSATGLFGGVFGTVAGIWVPRGTKKKVVYSMGIMLATAGICARRGSDRAGGGPSRTLCGYPLVLCGGILSFSMSWANLRCTTATGRLTCAVSMRHSFAAKNCE